MNGLPPPEELCRLVDGAALEGHERFGAGLGAAFGETHVARVGGRWRLFTRGSLVDPLREIEVSQGVAPRIEAAGFRERLVFTLAAGGEDGLEIGFLDREGAQALARDWLAPAAPSPAAPAEPLAAAEPRAVTPEPVIAVGAPADLAAARQGLVDALADRAAASRSRLISAARARAAEPARTARARSDETPAFRAVSRATPRSRPVAPPAPLARAPRPPARAPEPLFQRWHLVVIALAAIAFVALLVSGLRGGR
jgi:hypothetical protein